MHIIEKFVLYVCMLTLIYVTFMFCIQIYKKLEWEPNMQTVRERQVLIKYFIKDSFLTPVQEV